SPTLPSAVRPTRPERNYMAGPYSMHVKQTAKVRRSSRLGWSRAIVVPVDRGETAPCRHPRPAGSPGWRHPAAKDGPGRKAGPTKCGQTGDTARFAYSDTMPDVINFTSIRL